MLIKCKKVFPLVTVPLLAVFFISSIGLAATPAGGNGQAKGVVTKVNSDKMVYNSDAGKVTFSKNVKVVHPDFTMTSEKLDLLLAKSVQTTSGQSGAASSSASSLDSGKVETAIAYTDVRITLPQGRSARCSKATYSVREEVLKMEGEPVLREDGNLLRADIIYFYFKENRSHAEGNVRVDFVSKESQGGATATGVDSSVPAGTPAGAGQ